MFKTGQSFVVMVALISLCSFYVSIVFATGTGQIATAPLSDDCPTPETTSHGRLLEIIGVCCPAGQKNDCSHLANCLTESLIQISQENMADCLAQQSVDDGQSTTSFRPPCSVAATAYVILEQIRRLLVEDTIYRSCHPVKRIRQSVLSECDSETPIGDKISNNARESDINLDDLSVQSVFAKFLIEIGRKLQTYDVIRADIAKLEKTKHIKALAAMLVSFAVPGLLGLCEAAHFRTGFTLQTLALFVIGLYQFNRYGGYWAAVGVGSCLLIMAVEIALIVLINKKMSSQEEKKID